MVDFVERNADKIKGVLSCWDRVMISGTLPRICYAGGMTSYLYSHKVRIFDYPRWAEPLRDSIRANAEGLARKHGIEIEFIRKSSIRKEERVREILQERGEHPGLVAILSAMERCGSYRPWHDKKSGKTFLKGRTANCLHYYFYFMDETLGLCFVRVPTWCPFRIQFYYNGHNRLQSALDEAGIGYEMLDNCFVDINDFDQAQRLADEMEVPQLHAKLDEYALLCCPVTEELGEHYHWSIMQIEYSTDIVFRRRRDLAPIYESLVRTAVHAVKPDNIATFLGRKLSGNYRGEVGNELVTRILGTRIKHRMGANSIKMYDKHGIVLRIETTSNDVSFFKHYREVEHRDGSRTKKLAPVRKTIYSLGAVRKLLCASNLRYLTFISQLVDPSVGVKALEKVTRRETQNGRNYKGFNFLSEEDFSLFIALVRGETCISGFRNRDLRLHLRDKSTGQISRSLKRLRVHGLVKRVGRTYKYYLTKLGGKVITTALKLRELVVIPQLAALGNGDS